LKKYVIKRDEKRSLLLERLTRYRSRLNEQQFRVVTLKPARLWSSPAAQEQTRRAITPRRVFNRAETFRRKEFLRRHSPIARSTQRVRLLTGSRASHQIWGWVVSPRCEDNFKKARRLYRLRFELFDFERGRRARFDNVCIEGSGD